MQRLRNSALADFRGRLSAHVRSLLPDASDAEIATLCDRVMQDSAEYSLDRESDIARYAAILLRDGQPGNARLSEAERNTLLAHGEPAEERLSRVEGFMAAPGEGTGAAEGPAFSAAMPGQTVVPCGKHRAPFRRLYWIEIELVGDDDQPIEGEEYLLVLPDGKIVRGYLDRNGWARRRLEQGGTCVLTFPRLDQEAWTFVESLPARPVEA